MELGLKNEEHATCRFSVLRYKNIYALTFDWQRYMVFLILFLAVKANTFIKENNQ